MCIIYADKDQHKIEGSIQSDLENIIKWSHDNGIIINMSKTKGMHLSSPHNIKKCKQYNIIGHTYDCLHKVKQSCACSNIEFVDSFKYLGLTIERTFNWKLHIQTLSSKLRYIYVTFLQLRKYVNRKTLRTLYCALIEPHIEYGLVAYGRTFKTQLDMIKALQIRYLKLIVSHKQKQNCNKNYEQLFQICNILPVHEKFKLLIASHNYNIDPFIYKRSEDSIATRRKPKLFPDMFSANNCYGERTVEYLILKIFNALPEKLFVEEIKTTTFKKHVKKKLLEKCTQDQ
jgi:hypothetical protein